MILHLFQSTKEPDLFGFTIDETGGKLPEDFGSWKRVSGSLVKTGPDRSAAGFGNSNKVMAAVERDGFYLVRSDATVIRVIRPGAD